MIPTSYVEKFIVSGKVIDKAYENMKKGLWFNLQTRTNTLIMGFDHSVKIKIKIIVNEDPMLWVTVLIEALMLTYMHV